MIDSIDVRFVSHATEDEARLREAAEKVFGAAFSVKKTEGHWGNPIRIFEATLKKGEAEKLLRRVARAVPVHDFSTEKGNFFVRVSKSALLRSELVPGDDVQLHVRIRVPHGSLPKKFISDFWKSQKDNNFL